MAPLTWLTKKDQPFSWGVEAKNAFQFLNASFTTTPFLIHAYTSKPFVLETDTFDFVVGVVLSQFEKNNFLHLINFDSHKFSPMETNYEILDKELLTIVDAFEEWRHLLEGAQHEVTMYSDHKNL
jgi:hypothetical protein